MSKITSTKLNRAIWRNSSTGVRRITGFVAPQERRETLVKHTGRNGEVYNIQVFLSVGEACNPRKRFKKELVRRKKIKVF